jgi:hypothetical protein
MNIDTEWIVGLVGILMVLALNWRSVRSNPAPTSTKVRMVLIWGVIIVAVVLLVKLLQP